MNTLNPILVAATSALMLGCSTGVATDKFTGAPVQINISPAQKSAGADEGAKTAARRLCPEGKRRGGRDSKNGVFEPVSSQNSHIERRKGGKFVFSHSCVWVFTYICVAIALQHPSQSCYTGGMQSRKT